MQISNHIRLIPLNKWRTCIKSTHRLVVPASYGATTYWKHYGIQNMINDSDVYEWQQAHTLINLN